MFNSLVTLCDRCVPPDVEVKTAGLPDMECDFCGTFGHINCILQSDARPRLEELLKAELMPLVGKVRLRPALGEKSDTPVFDYVSMKTIGRMVEECLK